MHLLRKSILVAACLAPVSFAFAQSPDLERRVDTLERKLDAILELLQQQTGAGAPPFVRQAKPEMQQSTPEGFVPGIYMDVYAPADKNLWDSNGQRDLPDGIASASVPLRPTSRFSYAEITKHGETSNFAQNKRALPALLFSGYLHIKDAGKQSIGLNLDQQASRCLVKLIINGQKVLDKLASDRGYHSYTESLSLSSGLYKIQVYFECDAGFVGFSFDQQNLQLVMAGPGERAPKAVPSELLFIKQ